MRRSLWIVLAMACLFAMPTVAQEFVEAAAEGDLVRMKRLLAETPSVLNQASDVGKTAAHFAAQNNHLEILRYLYAQGADVDTPNIVGQTPLLYAVYFGHEDAVRFLLDQGVAVDQVDGYGDTVLDMAVMEGFDGIVAALRAHGAVETEIGAPEVVQLAPQICRFAFPYVENPNILLQTGSSGVLVVDTGWKRTAKLLVAQIQDLAEAEADLVVNTHSHPDHHGGNDALALGGAPIIGLTTLDEAVTAGLIEPGSGPLTGAGGATFDTWYRLIYNDDIIHLIPYPGIHTEHDMLVHFTGAKVAHIGDLLIGQSFPSVEKDVDGYLAFLDLIERFFEPDVTLVCGHGANMTPAEVGAYRRMLTEVRDLVLAKLDAGQDVETIKACSELERYADYGVFIPILSSDYWVEAIGRQFADS